MMSNAASESIVVPGSTAESDPAYIELEDLKAQATAKYSVKNYETAADLYSQATELQDKLNGEMSPRNADLLYAYGRCLYHLAVRKSDLLGSRLPGEEVEKEASIRNKKEADKKAEAEFPSDIKRTEAEAVSKVAREKDLGKNPNSSSKPFNFTGDENFEDSDEAEGDDEGEDEEPEDDFANAYEILDSSRILLKRRLETEKSADAEGTPTDKLETIRQIRERLADTYDLQAEILLEGERFAQAVLDLQAALDLKLELFPRETSLVAEAHYKLSLALEFSSVTHEKGVNGEELPGAPETVDEAMREEAALHMEHAITSCRLRISKEEGRLGTTEQKASQSEIDDVKEMVQEMQDRLVELRQPPVSVQNPRGTGVISGAAPQGGILGSLLGESTMDIKARLEAASNEAKDLTGLVKKKKSVANGTTRPSAGVKRKEVNGEDSTLDDVAKKIKLNIAEEFERR